MHILKKFLLGICLLGGLTCLPALWAEDLEENLVAKWTFKDGSLTSDSGQYTLTPGGTGVFEPSNGSVTLRGHKYLLTPDISAAKFPTLTKNVTMWARVRFDELPTETLVNAMGLLANPKAGSWDNISFSLIYQIPTAPGGFGFLAKLAEGFDLGVGPARLTPVSAGETVTVAVVFNSSTHTASVWVNGKLAPSKRPDAKTLKDFSAFGIGQLQSPGANCVITFEEVRIYSTALDAQWLEEITPSKK